MRENGYYWVKTDNTWLVAEWYFDHWYYCGNETEYADTEYEEIGEKVERKDYDSNNVYAVKDKAIPDDRRVLVYNGVWNTGILIGDNVKLFSGSIPKSCVTRWSELPGDPHESNGLCECEGDQ